MYVIMKKVWLGSIVCLCVFLGCVIGAVVGIMIIKEHQKKITANVGTVQHVEKPNVWVKTALYTVGETFAIYVLFFLLSATF